MSFSPEKRNRAEKLRRKLRIGFEGARSPHKWPAEHRETFTSIRDLGNITYDNYAIDIETTATHEPWKFEIKDLAKQLTERAERCARRNEASWRFSCENLVFARLSAEVSCRECRKRIWRSELEASKNENSGSARALKRRQNNREPCRCPRNRRQDIHEAVGLNPIFTHREEEKVHHDPSLQNETLRGDQPDRVYGLRQTRNFESALYADVEDDSRGRGTIVRDLLQKSPVSEDGDPLLFPFLVHEAKSGKSDFDWHSIKLQTAVPIRTFLDVQQSLRTATGLNSKWESGPLVWFFMNRGEDWHLCAAFMEEEDDDEGEASDRSNSAPVYTIMDLWTGSIISKDGALQLFLLVDYICDWARDVYREAIITELRILSAGTDDIASVYADSDIFSTAEHDFPETYSLSEECTEGMSKELDEFRKLDSHGGMVRHAAFFESRFCALFITPDNVQTLLHSTDETVIQYFSRQILTQLSNDSVLLDVDTLDAIEQQWTGNARCSRTFHTPQVKFYTIVLYSTYMSPFWQQIRELSVIAVAENAFSILVEASKLARGKGRARKPQQHIVTKEHMLEQVSRLRSVPMQDRLLGAIQRISVRISWLDFQKESGPTRIIVHYVYNSFKRGKMEPSESFLRVSSRYEQEYEQKAGAEPRVCLSENLHVSKSGSVLIRGRGRFQRRGWVKEPEICLYFVEGAPKAPDEATLEMALKDTFENNDVYHTTRDNGTSNIKSTNPRYWASWNLSRTYGVHLFGNEVTRWYAHLKLDPPTRQGSPREQAESGEYLLYKNYDPPMNGYPAIDSYEKEFMIYKIFLREIRYWRKVAKSRTRRGIECCSACAKKGSSTAGLCLNCSNEIDFPVNPRWVADALSGQDPPRWTPSRKPASDNDEENRAMAEKDERYRALSWYPNLNAHFKDIADLRDKSQKFSQFRYARLRESRTWKPTPRTELAVEITPTRSSTANNQENSDDDDDDDEQDEDDNNDRRKRRKVSPGEDDEVQFLGSFPVGTHP